jgi:hypothetical protein
MKLDPSSIVAGEYLFLGLILFTVPDLFLNPVDGYFKALSGVCKTALESNHLDPITEITTNMIGACFLTLAASLLAADNPMKKNDVLRTCLYFHVFLTLVCGHAVFQAADNPYLNLPVIGVATGHSFVYMLWFLVESLNEAATDKMERTPASWPRIAYLVFILLALAPVNVLNLMDPHYADPGHAMAFWLQTTLPDNTMDDLAIFHTRALGAVCMAFVCSTLEALAFDRSVERLHWFSLCGFGGNALYLVVSVRAALDSTGYALNEAWAMQSIVIAVFLLIQLPDVLWYWDAEVPKKSGAHMGAVPGLVMVEDKKKVN